MKWIILCLAACTSSTHPPGRRDVTAAVPAHPILPTVGPIPSPHGGKITELAMTADGEAALSADVLGSVRLWPALDGSVEPHVVDLPAPKALAITRAPRGFLIAAIDGAGNLTVQVVDPRGSRVQRSSHAGDPAFEGMVAGAAGMFAWRADHTVVRFSDDGAISAQLAASPGERVRAVVCGGAHVVAVVEDPLGVLRVRRLQLGTGLAWGALVPLAEPLFGRNGVLSPDGKLFASTRPLAQGGMSSIDVFDLTTGARLLAHPVRGELAIGFATTTRLAAAIGRRTMWVDLEHPEHGSSAHGDELKNPFMQNAPLVAASGVAIAAAYNELRISRPTEDRYLGYRFTDAFRAAAGPRGEIVIPANERAIVLGRDLRELRDLDRTTLGTNPGDVLAPLVWLADDTWFVQDFDVEVKKTRGRLVDVRKGTSTVLYESSSPSVVRFEPSTGLLTRVAGTAYEIHKLERTAGRLVPVHEGEFPRQGLVEVIPVAPELAMGAQLAIVTNEGRNTEMLWCRQPDDLTHCTKAVTEGYPVAYARDGLVLVYDAYATRGTKAFRQGRQTSSMAADLIGSRWPSPDGTIYVLLTTHEVMLLELDGRARWRRALGGIHSALWASDGAIVLLSRHGLVRVDPRTGEPLAARCGWKFELSPTPHEPTANREPPCTQL
ncbi:MAG: hypothetical protein SFX73_24010 [Kofleriaceae bacterium]|nr:hypothetical protein [Kofleriaceae bacterium]